MENKLLTTITRSPDLGNNAPIMRTNLSRFGIFVDVPPALAALIINVFDMLPEPDARDFPGDIALAIQPGADLTRVPALFLQWLLTDPQCGAIALCKRDDIKESIELVARNVLAPKGQGLSVDALLFKKTLFLAQVAQLKTWHAYRDAQSAEGMQPRIDWMIAAAATDSLQPHLPEQLVGAVHSCAVAWLSARLNSSNASPSFDLYTAIRDQLLALLKRQPGFQQLVAEPHTGAFDQVGAGDRVTFDDAQEGPQTGRVIEIVNSPNAAPVAVILVDHSLEGVHWKVPLAKLTRLEATPA